VGSQTSEGPQGGWRKLNLDSGRIDRRYLGMALLFVILVAVGSPLVASRGSRVPQPVAFNHKKHTQELGLTCEFCHKYVRTGAHSGLPDVETCSMCHQVRQGTSAEAAKVTELIAAGDRLQFNKLFRMPSHVFYTHRRHVGIAELECSECHGAVGDTERPPDRALIRITMEFCMDCHREQGQTLDCNACHR
jgi:hypothetical protein